MKNFISWATVVASLFVVLSLAAESKAQAPNPGGNVGVYKIGVVDISYIFKKHERFRGMMEQMKTDVQATEKQLRDERKQIQQREEELKQYNPGSPDYKRLDDALVRLKSEFNLDATRRRKDFLEREAKIYYQAYLEVNDAVKYYAQRNNLGLVLRFNGDPINPNRREDVLRSINKPIVYQNGIDITPAILAALNRSPQPKPGPKPKDNRNAAIPGRRTN